MLLNDTFLDNPAATLGTTPDASGVAYTILDGAWMSGGSGVGAYATVSAENLMLAPSSLWPTNPVHSVSMPMLVFGGGAAVGMVLRAADGNNYVEVSFYQGSVYLQKNVSGTFSTITTAALANIANNDSFEADCTATTVAIKFNGTQIIAPQTLTDQALINGLGVGLRQYNTSAPNSGIHAKSLAVTQAAPALTSGTASGASSGSGVASVTSTAASGGTSPYTYQWQRSTSSSGGFAIVSGATSLSLNDSGLTNGTPYYYRLVATDSASATVTSNVVTETPSATATDATGYALSFNPSSGVVGSVTTVTVNLIGGTALAGGTTLVVNFTDGTAGGSASIPNGQTSGTGSYTPASAASKTITATHTGPAGIADPSPYSYTVATGPATVTAALSAASFSPYNCLAASDNSYMEMLSPGSHFFVDFSGTSFAATFDLSRYVSASAAPASYPSIEYSIDDGPWTKHQFAPSDSATPFALASALAAGTHKVALWFISVDVTLDRASANPVGTLRVDSFTVDAGAALSATPGVPTAAGLGYLDSTGEGAEVLGNGQAGTNARLGVLADYFRALGLRPGIVAYSSQGYNTAGQGGIPAMSSYWQYYKTGSSRLVNGLFSPQPSLIFCGHGENDGDAIPASTVTSLIGQWRAAAPNAPIVIAPPGTNPNFTASTSGVTAANDAKAYFATTGLTLIDKSLSGGTATATNAFHYNQYGAALMGSRLAVLTTQATGGTTATATYTAAANVRLGTDRGDGTIGTLIVPTAAVVLSSNTFDNGTAGAYVAPSVGNVRLGTAFGASGVSHGTLALPPASDVEAGIGFGAGGSEFTGTLVAGSGSGGGLTQADADLVVASLLASPDALETGRTFRQSERKILAALTGTVDVTSDPGFARYLLEDGTVAMILPIAGRSAVAFGSEL